MAYLCDEEWGGSGPIRTHTTGPIILFYAEIRHRISKYTCRNVYNVDCIITPQTSA
jgi:hypothetical protein